MPVAPSATAAPADPIAPPPVTELTLVLEWSPGPQHAALLVAQEKGLFSRRGLNVVLQTPADPDVPAKLVAASQAELALTDQLTLHRLVDQGRPIIRVATLSELPLSGLLIREDADIDTVLGLIDHRVGYAQRSSEDVLLRAILQHEGLNLSHVDAKDVHFSVVRAMNEGWIDAFIGGAALSLPRELADLGIATRVLPTETLGIPVHDGLGRRGQPRALSGAARCHSRLRRRAGRGHALDHSSSCRKLGGDDPTRTDHGNPRQRRSMA